MFPSGHEPQKAALTNKVADRQAQEPRKVWLPLLGNGSAQDQDSSELAWYAQCQRQPGQAECQGSSEMTVWTKGRQNVGAGAAKEVEPAVKFFPKCHRVGQDRV